MSRTIALHPADGAGLVAMVATSPESAEVRKSSPRFVEVQDSASEDLIIRMSCEMVAGRGEGGVQCADRTAAGDGGNSAVPPIGTFGRRTSKRQVEQQFRLFTHSDELSLAAVNPSATHQAWPTSSMPLDTISVVDGHQRLSR